MTVGIVEVTRRNKDSGVDVRFRGHLPWGRDWGMAPPPRPGSGPRQGKKEAGLQMGDSPTEAMGELRVLVGD